MKRLISFFKIAIVIALFLDLFFCLMAHGSGHKIPSKTDWSFGLSAFILIVFLMYLVHLKKFIN
jgi:hypothetical protein